MFNVDKNNIWPIWTTSQLASLRCLSHFSRVLFSYALFRLGSKDTCFSALSFASTISVKFREKSWISPNPPRQGPKFRKLQEAIWLNVINKIFKFPKRLDTFRQINYLYELFPGYPNYPTQKWNIWASFQFPERDFVNNRKPYG